MTLVELIYNFWELSHKKFDDNEKGYKLQWCGNYYHLKDVMDDLLGQYNHIAYISEEQEYVLVVEDKAEVTAAAEIMPTSTFALEVVKYNHRTLSGEIELKKKILLAMGSCMGAYPVDGDTPSTFATAPAFETMAIRRGFCRWI